MAFMEFSPSDEKTGRSGGGALTRAKAGAGLGRQQGGHVADTAVGFGDQRDGSVPFGIWSTLVD
jgi:hypothetical protein